MVHLLLIASYGSVIVIVLTYSRQFSLAMMNRFIGCGSPSQATKMLEKKIMRTIEIECKFKINSKKFGYIKWPIQNINVRNIAFPKEVC